MIDISNTSNNQQQTIGKPVSIKGIGLHTGSEVTMKLYPAKIEDGIKFIRKDLTNNNIIEALWSNVTNTKLSTTISNQSGASVSTIEHLMSALSGLHIDNLKIETLIDKLVDSDKKYPVVCNETGELLGEIDRSIVMRSMTSKSQ